MIVSFLHFGQYRGKFLNSVSSRIIVRVLLPQIGHSIHCCLLISIILRLRQFLIHFSYIISAYTKLYYPYNYKN